MLDIETGYIKVEGRDHTVLNYHQSDDEIELEVDEYYVFGYSDYQSYIYAYSNMR